MTSPDDTEFFAQQIAAELRAELGRQNRSKRWLAEQAGYSHVTVTRWLTDGHITIGHLHRLCGALGVSTVDMIGRVRPADHPFTRSGVVAAV